MPGGRAGTVATVWIAVVGAKAARIARRLSSLGRKMVGVW